MIILIGSDERVEEFEPDEELADSFPCMSTQPFDREARAQLYSLVTHTFLDDAWAFEQLFRAMTDEGPYFYKLDEDLVARLSGLDEDDIGDIAEDWLECEELESVDPEVTDLYEYLYQLVHLCRTAGADDDLGVFVFTDG